MSTQLLVTVGRRARTLLVSTAFALVVASGSLTLTAHAANGPFGDVYRDTAGTYLNYGVCNFQASTTLTYARDLTVQAPWVYTSLRPQNVWWGVTLRNQNTGVVLYSKWIAGAVVSPDGLYHKLNVAPNQGWFTVTVSGPDPIVAQIYVAFFDQGNLSTVNQWELLAVDHYTVRAGLSVMGIKSAC